MSWTSTKELIPGLGRQVLVTTGKHCEPFIASLQVVTDATGAPVTAWVTYTESRTLLSATQWWMLIPPLHIPE